jgi:hypothetical protein
MDVPDLLAFDLLDDLVGQAGCGQRLALGGSGCQAVDPDGVGCQFQGPASGEVLDRGFGGGVVPGAGYGAVSVGAGQVDDRATGRSQMRQRGLCEEAGGGHVQFPQLGDALGVT